MAFATSGVQSSNAGDLNRLIGTWSGAEGDAAGTVTVGGIVYNHQFSIHDSQSGEDRPVPCSISYSTTTGLSTITVYNKVGVTTGRFSVDYR